MRLKRLGCFLIYIVVGLKSVVLASDLGITTIVERVYYPDLPIYVSFLVTNTGSNLVWVNSVGRGTPWVRPEVLPAKDKPPVELCHVLGVLWRDSVKLAGGGTLTGRLDVARFLATTQEGMNGLPPGEYQLTLHYQFGTNLVDQVKSVPVSFSVREPEIVLSETRRKFHEVRRVSVTSTNLVPVSMIPSQEDLSNPYSLALKACYAHQLSRRGRFSEALSAWNNLLPAGNTIATDSLETKEEIANCYIGLKRVEEARHVLETIKNQSDSAYGILRILDRKTTPLEPGTKN